MYGRIFIVAFLFGVYSACAGPRAWTQKWARREWPRGADRECDRANAEAPAGKAASTADTARTTSRPPWRPSSSAKQPSRCPPQCARSPRACHLRPSSTSLLAHPLATRMVMVQLVPARTSQRSGPAVLLPPLPAWSQRRLPAVRAGLLTLSPCAVQRREVRE